MANYVIPECYIDTNLIEYLTGEKANHQHSCTKVVHLLKDRFSDSFAIGIIDNDKVRMGILEECDRLGATAHISLYKRRNHHQYIFTISPATDGFALFCASEIGLDLGEFGLPSKLKDFTKVSKSVTSNRDNRFKALFAAIKDHREMLALKKALNYLMEAKYGADPNQLSALLSSFA